MQKGNTYTRKAKHAKMKSTCELASTALTRSSLNDISNHFLGDNSKFKQTCLIVVDNYKFLMVVL